MECFEILSGIAVINLIIYYFLTSTFDFWKSRGVCGPRPSILKFGTFKDIILSRISMSDYLTKIYNTYKDDSLIGIFVMKEPVLIVKDLDLIKDILIKDFINFADRGLSTFEKAEPLSQHLFRLEPKRWRPLRTKLLPVFTSIKLKQKFSLISTGADYLVQCLEKVASKTKPVECRELMAKYMTCVICSYAFGIEMNTLSIENNEFRKMGRKFFATNTWTNTLRIKIRQFFPKLYNMLGYILPQTEVIKFFTRVIMKNMDYRETNNIIKNDLIDTLCELKKHPDELDIHLTDSLLASQAFLIFFTGTENPSTTITNALYELALNQKIQDDLRKEIDEVYAKHGGEFTYDNIKNMDYLDKIFKETLRKYPPATFLMRQSASSYTFNGTRVSVPKYQKVWIPTYAIHRDPSIYPEPDVFNPERFTNEAVQNRHPMSYLPFGAGSRNCIGARFAAYQIKIGLIKIIRNYKVKTCEKTPIFYINNPRALLLIPKDGLYMRIIKINRI